MFEDWPGLTDEQWHRIQGLLPPPPPKPRRRRLRRGGRPRADDRKAFEALLYALRGGVLERLPARFGSRRTTCRRLARWVKDGTLGALWHWHFEGMSAEEALAWHDAFAARRLPAPFWQMLLRDAFAGARPRPPFSPGSSGP